jgi:glycolate oxidase iron-sulfur subunit
MSEPKKLRLETMDYSVLQQCMHCGMCLPTCPTYAQTQRERNSPRGRIAWMRAIADGQAEIDKDFADEMYDCLGCLACVSACPAGVDYPHLFEAARADVEEQAAAGSGQRVFWRWLAVKTIFMHPRLLRLVGRSLRIYQARELKALVRRSGLLKLLPKRLADLEPQTPDIQARFTHQLIQPVETPTTPRYRVGLLSGCVQDLAFSDINRDTADVLLHNNCEVITPAVQHCCGSLHAHNGELGLAQKLARLQIDLFKPESLDAIISNAGGCGSHLKTYGHLLADDPEYAERAHQWDRKLKDIHEWLVEIDFTPPAASGDSASRETVTYHESCHLCHGQKIRLQPRKVLDAIPNLQRVELKESDWCCGSAGIYNITRPETAGKLLDRKMQHINATGSAIITTSNPGCHIQIQNGLKQSGKIASVRHPISLLAEAYRKNEEAIG